MSDNLGVFLGGFADARASRESRDLQARALGIQERQLEFSQAAEQRKLVDASLTELTDLASQVRATGDPNGGPIIEMLRRRVAQTANAAGMDPASRVALFDAALAGTVTPEQEAANKAIADVTGAQTIADVTGAELNDVLQAQGFLPADADQFRTLSDNEKVSLGLPAGVVAQISEDSGEIKIVSGDRQAKIRSAIDTQTGQSVFVRESDIINNPGQYAPIPSGLKLVQGPDGGFVLATGTQTANAADITKTTRTGLEKEEINVRRMLSRIENIDAAFDPEFLTFGARAESLWLSIKERAGAELTDDEREFQSRYTQFATRTIGNINARLNELSGAAVSPAEADRLRSELPDAESDSPTQFMAKVRDLKKRLKMEAMKLSYARRRGLDAISLSVDDFEAIIEQRGKTLEAELKLANPQALDVEIRALVRDALLEEFSQ